MARAVQLPSQLFGAFRADHVPVSTISLASFNKLHDPLAAFGVPCDTCASQVPRIRGPFPTLAVHIPVRSLVGLCPRAVTPTARLITAIQKVQNKKDQIAIRIESCMCAPISVIPREQAALSPLASPPLARENTNSNRFHKFMTNRVAKVSVSVRRAIAPLIACALAVVPAFAQKCTFTPKSIKLGETLRLTCPPEFTSATLNGRSVKLFPQSAGNSFALLPISVKDDPGAATLTVSRNDGAQSQQLSVVVRKTIFPSQNVKLGPEIEALHSTPEEIALLTAFKGKVSDSRSWQDPLAPPVPGCMTSPFGVKRLHNGKPTGEYHGGVDQRTPAGEPIRAVAAGTITFAQQFNVLGNAVGIDHGQGLESMYLHMSRLVATSGAQVQRGDILGYAGSTGRSTGPHLHWVLYVNGINVNPAQWMKLSPCPREPKTH